MPAKAPGEGAYPLTNRCARSTELQNGVAGRDAHVVNRGRRTQRVDRQRVGQRPRVFVLWICALVTWTVPIAVSWAGPAAAALADCVPPTVTYDAGSARRGDTIRVMGTAWGDDCLDTTRETVDGGLLGRPLDDIEVFIKQGSSEVLVARGAANERYQFEVEVPIPPDLEPGPASVVARANGSVSVDNSPGTLTISTDAPAATTWAVVEFGPEPGGGSSTATTPAPSVSPTTASVVTPAASSATQQDSSGGSAITWLAAAAIAAAIAALALWLVRRGRQPGEG